jgi:hypothetical protein
VSAKQTQAARDSRRCAYIRPNGIPCGSPALRGDQFCYFHYRISRRHVFTGIPPLEDANSVQVAVMEVFRGIFENTIDHKKASLLLYALQTASANLKNVNFWAHQSEMVTELPEAQRKPVSPQPINTEEFKTM